MITIQIEECLPLRLVDLPVCLGPSQPKADGRRLSVACNLAAQTSRPVFLLRLPVAAQDSQGSPLLKSPLANARQGNSPLRTEVQTSVSPLGLCDPGAGWPPR